MTEQHIQFVKSVTQPRLIAQNPWIMNELMQNNVGHLFPKQFTQLNKELSEFGEHCNKVLYPLSIDAEMNQPKLVKQDVYGNVVDQLLTTEGWRKQKSEAAEQGIVGLAYEQTYGEYSRLIQLIRLCMYQPVSGLYGCPLAMTDGAAFLLQQWLQHPTTKDQTTNQLVQQAFINLTSRDPKKMWTSGQWMTEKDGGSDVSNSTTTIAIHQSDNNYKLYGYKWFSSATDSDISLVLARIVPKDKQSEFRKYPLSLFIIRVKDDQGKLNNITIMTLKDKMGTRQLPTAELLLNGTDAYLISQEGKGIKAISHMLNVTRLYNASCAVGSMNRLYSIVLNYSTKRKAFGKELSQLPAHQALLTKFSLANRGCNQFYFKLSFLFSKIHANTATNDESTIFRIMTPLLKLYTAKLCMNWMSEGLEALGALGYMENSNIPVMFRDAQVLTIWEGTTNVLCLDFLRALKSTDQNDPLSKLDVYARQITHIMMTFLSADTQLPETRKTLVSALAKLTNNHNGVVAELAAILKESGRTAERRIRDLAFILCETFVGCLLLEMISKNGLQEDLISFELWMEQSQVYSSQWLNTESAFQTLVAKDLHKSRL